MRVHFRSLPLVLLVAWAAAPVVRAAPYDTTPGNFWSQTFVTEYQPNVVNLWTSHPSGFNGFGTLPAGWVYQQASPSAQFAQLYTTGPYGAGNLTWQQYFYTPTNPPGGFALDWQEVSYDWSTGTVVGGTAGSLNRSGASWSLGTYGAAGAPITLGGQPVLLAPVPEPGTLAVFGLGALGLAVARARRRRDRGAG